MLGPPPQEGAYFHAVSCICGICDIILRQIQSDNGSRGGGERSIFYVCPGGLKSLKHCQNREDITTRGQREGDSVSTPHI